MHWSTRRVIVSELVRSQVIKRYCMLEWQCSVTNETTHVAWRVGWLVDGLHSQLLIIITRSETVSRTMWTPVYYQLLVVHGWSVTGVDHLCMHTVAYTLNNGLDWSFIKQPTLTVSSSSL